MIGSIKRPCRTLGHGASWNMGTNGTLYDDPGADYFNRLHPERAKKRAIHQLQAMGYNVTLRQLTTDSQEIFASAI